MLPECLATSPNSVGFDDYWQKAKIQTAGHMEEKERESFLNSFSPWLPIGLCSHSEVSQLHTEVSCSSCLSPALRFKEADVPHIPSPSPVVKPEKEEGGCEHKRVSFGTHEGNKIPYCADCNRLCNKPRLKFKVELFSELPGGLVGIEEIKDPSSSTKGQGGWCWLHKGRTDLLVYKVLSGNGRYQVCEKCALVENSDPSDLGTHTINLGMLGNLLRRFRFKSPEWIRYCALFFHTKKGTLTRELSTPEKGLLKSKCPPIILLDRGSIAPSSSRREAADLGHAGSDVSTVITNPKIASLAVASGLFPRYSKKLVTILNAGKNRAKKAFSSLRRMTKPSTPLLWAPKTAADKKARAWMDFFFEVKKLRGDAFGNERLPGFSDRKSSRPNASGPSRTTKECRFGSSCSQRNCRFVHPKPRSVATPAVSSGGGLSKMDKIASLLQTLLLLAQ
jgi:hypothetical protein